MSTLSTLQNIFGVVGCLAEGIAGGTFVLTGNARRLPFVSVFLLYMFATDMALLIEGIWRDPWQLLVITTWIGYVIETLALGELLVEVLKLQGRREGAKVFLTFTVAASALIAYAITYMRSYSDFGGIEKLYWRLDQGVSIFRVLVLVIAIYLLRKSAGFRDSIVAQTTVTFSVYAACVLMKHVLNELEPSIFILSGSFELGEITCSIVWTVLLGRLTFHVFRLTAGRQELHRTRLRLG